MTLDIAVYDIGYRRPPANKRWQKGQCGNSKGRPRGSKNTLSILNKLANQEVQIVQNGRKIKISKKAAALLQAVNKAAQGDTKALKTLMPHLLAADAKAEGRMDIFDAHSPKFQACFKMLTARMIESLDSVEGIDQTSRNHFLYEFGTNIIGIEDEMNKLVNDPAWVPDTEKTKVSTRLPQPQEPVTDNGDT